MPFTKSAVELFISDRAAAIIKCGASDMKTQVARGRTLVVELRLCGHFS